MNLEKTVADFLASVVAEWEAIELGDAKATNVQARRYIRAWGRLRAAGNQGREALRRLLVHDNAHVRVTAAAFLLRYRHDDARRVLEDEAPKEGMAAFEAQQALARWREGTWALDPPDEG